MDMHRLYSFASSNFRAKRMCAFFELFGVTPETKILDIGGSPIIWRHCPFRPNVTFVNTCVDWSDGPFKFTIGDATDLPFASNSFDIAFSNSVIEHLGSMKRQRLMAKEVRRVAPRYFVQTPNFWFPVEPHYWTPFVHYLPKSIRRHTLRWITLHGWMTKPTQEQVAAVVEEISLLTERQMRALFPDGAIYQEKVVGLTKSIAAYK